MPDRRDTNGDVAYVLRTDSLFQCLIGAIQTVDYYYYQLLRQIRFNA